MEKMKRVLVDIEDGHDHISALPNCILSHILSLLPTEDLVRVSCASKTLKSLCYPLSILDIDLDRFSKHSSLKDQKKQFSDFVDSMTSLYKDKHLKEFRLAIDISKFKQDRARIHKWVRFAITSDSSILDLDFLGGKVGTRLEIYAPWPVCFVPPLQSVEVLRLKHCSISLPPSDMSFSLLKTVVLRMVDCPDESIFDFIKNCPCLEELHLIKCTLPLDIGFEDPESTLKCLVIDSCETTDGFTHYIRIDIPNLLRFKFAGELLVSSYIVKPRNLIEVDLDIWEVVENIEDEYAAAEGRHYEILRELLTNMDNVNTLTLSSSCIQVLTDVDQTKALDVLVGEYESHAILPPPLPNLKHLTVAMSAGRVAVNVMCLLRSCPNLETLFVDFSCELLDDKHIRFLSLANDNGNEEYFWSSELLISKYLRHLKKVEIKGFEGRYVENIFINCILANSLVLEKMVIYKAAMKSRYAKLKRDGSKKKLKKLMADQRKAIEDLLTYERGSTRAQVSLSED